MSSPRQPEMANSNVTESGGRTLFPVSEYFARPLATHPPPFDRSTKPSARRQSTNGPARPTVSQGDSTDNMEIMSIPPQANDPNGTNDAQHRPRARLEGFQSMGNPPGPSDMSPEHMASFVTKKDMKARYDPEAELKTAGKWRVSREKVYLITGLVIVKYVHLQAPRSLY
jgi:hypothetical protein